MDPNLRQPYDIFPAIRRLKAEGATMSPEERRRVMATVALNAADRGAVALAIDMYGDDFAHIYPLQPEPEKVTTEGAIETFLDKFGHTSPDEDALLERLIFNPVPDYSGVLVEQAAKEDQDTLKPASDRDLEGLAAMASAINSTSQPDEQPDDIAIPDAPEEQSPAPTKTASRTKAPATAKPRQRQAEPALTLELAKIFIKQQRFDRAHEIISKISLNNPEKSVYFANQLRFLEKLIKIQQLQAEARESKR